MAGEKILIARQDTLEAVQRDTQAILADTAALGENVQGMLTDTEALGGDVQRVLDMIGTAADTGGSTTTGTLMGKGNEILRLLASSGAKVVKSIQKGTGKADVESSSTTINISPIDISKSILIVSSMFSHKDTTDLSWRLYKDRIEFSHSSQSQSYYVDKWYWQIIEFY